uniref:Uncharacterized protein n=1 Tax=viral metagenome TaxID=1070528 RepID=A0A6C0C8W9_9ZZZZ
MPFEGINLVLGYKISERTVREMFPDNVIYSSSSEEDGSDHVTYSSSFEEEGSGSEDGFDFYSFRESVNEFLAKKTKKHKTKFACHSLECCSYQERNSNWILGIKVSHIDGLDLGKLNLDLGAKHVLTLMIIYEELKINKYCRDSTPHLYALADGCVNCS